MIGVIWNCRGVGKKGIAMDIKNLLTETSVDFIGLQETMKRKYTEKFFRSIDSNRLYAWHWLPSQGRSGGILCGIKKENFDIIKVTEHEFAVEAEVWDKKTKMSLRLITIYGPTHEERREQFLRELSTICAKNELPMIVGGDFNILRYSNEKNKTFYANRFSDMFNREIALNGGRFTWSNNHADPTLEKLDRVLMNDKWEVAFPLTNLKKPRLMSDHNPLLLCTEQKINKKAKHFCFETSWTKHEELLPKIKEIWGKTVSTKNATEKWYIKLGRIKKFLKGWGDSLRGHTKKYRLIPKEELAEIERVEEEEILTATTLGRKHFIQAELLRLIEEEEMYWHKRSNENWLLKGDNNTGYFHEKTMEKRKNTIFHLEKDGENIDKEEDILKHATEYYRDLFGPSENPTFSLDPECWKQNEKINEEENIQLVKPFTNEEIKKVVKTMKKNTAPGPDHMPVEFYQSCWEIIREDIMDMIHEFWKNELDIDRLNYGVITLIPKIKEASKIQQYRPICLLNVSYKIITKALMLRFEECVSRIINKSQNAFLKGRNIMDGVLSLHEILHETKRKKREGVFLKLDFEKAYDRIS
jgi:hypothetical protein